MMGPQIHVVSSVICLQHNNTMQQKGKQGKLCRNCLPAVSTSCLCHGYFSTANQCYDVKLVFILEKIFLFICLLFCICASVEIVSEVCNFGVACCGQAFARACSGRQPVPM